MIVNEQEAVSRAMYWELKRRAPPDVPVYQQGPLQNDVWEALDGDKDDFLIYDRCGLLTFHVVLPYTLLNYPYVEAAIRATYFKNICNCTAHSNNTSSFFMTETSQLNQTSLVTSPPVKETDHSELAPQHHPHDQHQHQHHGTHRHNHHHLSHRHDAHHHDTNHTQLTTNPNP